MAGQKTSSLQRLHQEIRTAWLGTSSSGDLPQPEQIEKEKVYWSCMSIAVVFNRIICVHQLHTCLKTNVSTAVVFNKIISYMFTHKCVHCSCLQQDYLCSSVAYLVKHKCVHCSCVQQDYLAFINSIPVYTQMCPLQLSSTGLSHTCLNTNVSTAVVFSWTSSISWTYHPSTVNDNDHCGHPPHKEPNIHLQSQTMPTVNTLHTRN